MSVEPAGSSPCGGCMMGVCTVAKVRLAIQGVFLGRDLIHVIAASTGTVPRKVRARMSVDGTCSTLPSSRLMTRGDT